MVAPGAEARATGHWTGGVLLEHWPDAGGGLDG